MAANPMSQQTIESIKKWLQDCKGCGSPTEGHTICSLSQPAWIPSRLIEVKQCGQDFQAKLVYRNDLKDKPEYTALSYRWGGPVQGALSTINQKGYHQDGIPWRNLPKTLQDAAVTTFELGIRFLWIDSLCIVQDDQDDKDKEIGQMTRVYTHATLTIMARRASEANDPLLNERTAPAGTTLFTLNGANGQEKELTLHFPKAVFEKDTVDLDRRGWCFQEHLLSRRKLDIGPWVTTWSCRQDRDLSCNTDGWRPKGRVELHPDSVDGRWGDAYSWWIASDGIGRDHSKLPRDCTVNNTHIMDYIIFLSADPVDRHPRPSSESVLNRWWKVVNAYTQRSLSVPTDRPLAISGIAESFASSMPGGGDAAGSRRGYAAGLWEQDLPRSLLWMRLSRESYRDLAKDDPEEIDSRSPVRPYQGPSWSWTSINHEVVLDDCAIPAISRILSVECVPRHRESPFGAVESGMLRIDGPTFDIECRGTSRSYEVRQKGMSGDEFKPTLGFMIWDDIAEPFFSDWTSVTLLALLSGRNQLGNTTTKGIALTQAGGQYRRFGTFSQVVDPKRCDCTGNCSCIKSWLTSEVIII